MANKRFPADMADITADAVSVLGAKADGTVGSVTVLKSTGGTLTGPLNGESASFYDSVSITTGYGKGLLLEDGFSIKREIIGADFSYGGASRAVLNSSELALSVPLAGTSATFSGTVTAQGSVLTSAREKKHVFGDFKEDALSQIAALKMHRFAYKKTETEVLEPATINKKGEVTKAAKTRTVEIPAPEAPEHIGLMYDEVSDNPDIATPDGSIKLHNIVFLQARAIQQLTEQIASLTTRIAKLEPKKK